MRCGAPACPESYAGPLETRRPCALGAPRHAVRCGRLKTRSALWALQREELLLPDDYVPEEEGVSGVLHEEMFHTCAARQSPGGASVWWPTGC